jgi:hypothetical protein
MRRPFPPRLVRPLVALVVLAGVSACSDGPSAPPPPTTGNLVLAVSGLPVGLVPSFQVTDAEGASRTARANDTVRNLAPGVATVRPSSPSAAGVGRWVPFREAYDVSIVVGATTAETVQFAADNIILQVTPSGLPTDALAAARFTGPDGTVYVRAAGVPFVAPAAGDWTLAGLPVIANEYEWLPANPPVTRTLLPGDTAAATLPYVATSGAITITTAGLLDTTVAPRFTVRQGSTSFTRTGPGSFPNLAPGTWELTATPLSAAGFRFAPATGAQLVTVTAGATTATAVTFTATPIRANFAVEAAYFTQAVQDLTGSAPLVAGREALLRIFLRASVPNSWRPAVRAHLYDGATLRRTFDLAAGATGVDTALDEGLRERSWNVRVPGDLIVPGLRLLVEADPTGSIAADSDPSDNVWPRDGAPRAIAVRAVEPWRAVLVPVTNAPTSLTGNVSEANKDQFTTMVRRVMPIHEAIIRVREPYTSNVAQLQNNDGNGAWIALLGELLALQRLEARDEYLYGVVKVNYTSGIAGYGYVPGRAAVGWDYLPSGDRVAAHEWGHNFGRRHAPCGGVSGTDPQYPFGGGVIGAWGWNPGNDALIPPTFTDLMGYCGNQWVSAYTWSGALAYRAFTPGAMVQDAQGAVADARGGLLVWGDMTDGRVRLAPSFFLADHVSDRSAPPAADVTLRVEALDASGRVLASVLTPASSVDHASGDVRHFAVTLPLSAAQHEALATVRVQDVRSPLVGASRRRAAVTDARGVQQSLGAAVRIERAGARAHLVWDDARVAGALVRNAATGRVLSILRQTGGAFAVPSGDVEVIVSDGVRSTALRRAVR